MSQRGEFRSTSTDPYWSREKDECELATRVDPVVWKNSESQMDTPNCLPEDDLKAYESDGYHAADQLFSLTEAAELLREANQLAEDADINAPGVVSEPGTHIVRSLFRLHRSNDLFSSVAQDPRLIDIARQVLGSDVYVHQSRINFKPALSGKEFFWHSDFETWHIEDGMPRMRAVSVSISLTDNNEFNGPLMIIPKSHDSYVRCAGRTPENHYEHSLKKQEYGVPSQQAMRRLVEQGGIAAPKGPPGSALFFECNLMHGSVGNLSPYPRTNFFIVYNSVENAMVEPFGNQPPRPNYLAEREIDSLASQA